MLFYLKVNLNRDFMIKNVQHWVDAISLYQDAWIYFVCDDACIKERIEKEVYIAVGYDFIHSARSDVWIQDIVQNSCVKEWVNAGIAHLTTFSHAATVGENHFWNIDADDTRFCMDAKKITSMFCEVEKRANQEQIDCLSLDFYYTATFSHAWSFGVTYVNDASKCIRAMTEMVHNLCWKEAYQAGTKLTIDQFMRFIKYNFRGLIMDAFFVEDSVFIHYSDNVLYNPIVHGVYCWTEGILFRPLYYYVFGAKSESVYFISENIQKICVGASIEEGTEFLRNQTQLKIPKYAWREFTMVDFIGVDVLYLMQYLQEHNISHNEKIIIFGVGTYLRANWITISRVFKNIIGFSDNDPSKWNTRIVNNYMCIPPDRLAELNDSRVIVAVFEKSAADNIIEQLQTYGFCNVLWLRQMLKYSENCKDSSVIAEEVL